MLAPVRLSPRQRKLAAHNWKPKPSTTRLGEQASPYRFQFLWIRAVLCKSTVTAAPAAHEVFWDPEVFESRSRYHYYPASGYTSLQSMYIHCPASGCASLQGIGPISAHTRIMRSLPWEL